jgi:hypothetical protein
VTSSPSAEPPHVGTVTLRKVTLRLIPFLFVLYIVAWLDRVNVGFAALQMNSDLGFSSAAFGFGSGVFFLGYCLFKVPSNLVLHRVGARRWDRADHDELGRHLSRDGVRSDNARVLFPEISAGSRGSRFSPGDDLLLEPVVSGGATRARDRSVYGQRSR